MDDSTDGTCLPDDALAAVFIQLRDAAALVRCAATCRRWASVVAKEAAAIARALPPRTVPEYLDQLALGFFHGRETGTARARSNSNKRRKLSSAAAADPAAPFVPTAWGTPRRILRVLSHMRSPPLFAAGGSPSPRAVASRNGRVVLELQRERGHAGLSLCLWHPMTGDVALLPPLSGDDKPAGPYACALLTGDDGPPRSSSSAAPFFRVLIVHNRGGFTALRAYSSDTGNWSAEASLTNGSGSTPKIKAEQLRELGQGVVLRGVAYWHLAVGLGGASLLAVRFGTPPEPPAQVLGVPPPAVQYNFNRRFGLLGTTPHGKLCSIYAGIRGDHLGVVWTERGTHGDDDHVGVGGIGWASWERKGHASFNHILLERSATTRIHLRWFCEKSGVLFLTLADGCTCPGTFALSLASGKIRKVSDDVDDGCANSRSYFIGYEMDEASYLASI